jgi:YidC/Oxa1 family membrane protein insertase
MNDSLVMLWDGWTRHNGGPSMFSPATPAQVASAAASANGVPSASGVAQPAAAAAPGAVPAAAAAASAAGETVQIVTDTMKATLDSRGGSLVRVELLTFRDQHDAKTNVVLLDRSAQRVYTAETGLIAAGTGAALPNHFTVMRALPGERTLADGQKELSISFESPEIGGVQLVKTYTFRRGEYPVAVKHAVKNNAAAPVSPQLYLQLARDGNPPAGESSFYFTFTGPAMYTDASKFKKIEFKDIEKGNADHDKAADNGWVGMVQHYFASAWLLPDNAQREFRTAKVSNNFYSIAMVVPLGEVAPGASKDHAATLFAGPQEEKKLEALAPGLELVKDYGWLTILSKPLFWLLDKLHQPAGQLGLGHRRPGGAAEDRVLRAQCPRLQVHGQDEGHQPQGDGDARALQGQAAADAAGDDAHLPRGEDQPAGRLPADLRADAVLHRAVLGAAVERGNARCAVDRLDHRPVDERPVLHPAAADDGQHHVPDLAEPDAARSGAGQADVVHAADLQRDVLLLPGRPGAVLADEQRAGHRAAVVHQPPAGAEQVTTGLPHGPA